MTDSTKSKYLIYTACFLLGISQNSGYNALVNSYQYWMWKYSGDVETYKRRPRDVPGSSGNNSSSNSDIYWSNNFYQTYWVSFVQVLQEVAIFIVLVWYTISGFRIDKRTQTFAYISIMFVVQLLFLAFVEINTDHWYEIFFIVCLFLVIIHQGLAIGSLISASMGIAGILGYQYLNILTTGKYFSGLLIAILSIVSAYGFQEEITDLQGNEIMIVDQYKLGLMFFSVVVLIYVVTLIGLVLGLVSYI